MLIWFSFKIIKWDDSALFLSENYAQLFPFELQPLFYQFLFAVKLPMLVSPRSFFCFPYFPGLINLPVSYKHLTKPTGRGFYFVFFLSEIIPISVVSFLVFNSDSEIGRRSWVWAFHSGFGLLAVTVFFFLVVDLLMFCSLLFPSVDILPHTHIFILISFLLFHTPPCPFSQHVLPSFPHLFVDTVFLILFIFSLTTFNSENRGCQFSERFF